MAEFIKDMFLFPVNAMKACKLELIGIHFNLWQVFLFTLLAGVIIWVVKKLIS